MTRIVRVITRLNIGGPAQHVILLAQLLPQFGFEEVLVTGAVDRFEGDMFEYARQKGVAPVLVPSLSNTAGLSGNMKALFQLYRLFRKHRPTIVHLHLLKARAIGGLAARLARVPIVIESFHGTLFSEYFHPRVTKALVLGERILARLMDVVITVSPSVGNEIILRKVAPQAKVVTIPIGLELERFRDERKWDFRSEIAVGRDIPLVGAVCRLVPIKGLAYLIRALPRLKETVPDVQVVVVGDGPDRKSLEQLVDALGVRTQVRFLGWRRDLERIYPDLDIVVLPSLSEGTPVSLIEGMAAGRAVVASRVGGVPDLITDGANGLLVPARDPNALAERLAQLLQNPSLRGQLGRAAQATVFPRFTAVRLAADVAGLYRKVLDVQLAGGRDQCVS